MIYLIVNIMFILSNNTDYYSIDQALINEQKIYFGLPTKFYNPAIIDFELAIKSTPEYEKLSKTDFGTAKYWIILSRATDIVIVNIRKKAIESGFDLVVEKKYWNSLNINISSIDITNSVIETINNKEKNNNYKHK